MTNFGHDRCQPPCFASSLRCNHHGFHPRPLLVFMMVSVTFLLRDFMVFNILDFRVIGFLGFEGFGYGAEVALGSRRNRSLQVTDIFLYISKL